MIPVTRTYAALLLLIAYATLLIGQLAPMAMGSATIAHAITGECSGDCIIDGCSLASRANRTCCCWQKKQIQSPKMQTTKTASHAAKSSCCPTQAASSPPAPAAHCSNTTKPGELVTEPDEQQASRDYLPVYKCGCPCDDNRQLALWGFGKIEGVPFSFSDSAKVSSGRTCHFDDLCRLASRYGDPPDPPPKLSPYA